MEFKPKVGEVWRWGRKLDGEAVDFVITEVRRNGEVRGTSLRDGSANCRLVSEADYYDETGDSGVWSLVEDEFTMWVREVREETLSDSRR